MWVRNDPVRVIVFNTLEHWSDEVSEAIATEIQSRCEIEGVSVPEHIGDFVGRHRRPVRQLKLKLACQAYDTPGKTRQAASTPEARRAE